MRPGFERGILVGMVLILCLQSYKDGGWAWPLVGIFLPAVLWMEAREQKKLEANKLEIMERLGNMGAILNKLKGANDGPS